MIEKVYGGKKMAFIKRKLIQEDELWLRFI